VKTVMGRRRRARDPRGCDWMATSSRRSRWGRRWCSRSATMWHDAGGWIDVHLMIDRPEHQVEAFAKAGADSINIPLGGHARTCITRSRRYAMRALRGRPGDQPRHPRRRRSWPRLDTFRHPALHDRRPPGWGGQKFIDSSKDKVRRPALDPPGPRGDRGGRGDRPADRNGPLPRGRAPRLFVAGSAVFGRARIPRLPTTEGRVGRRGFLERVAVLAIEGETNGHQRSGLARHLSRRATLGVLVLAGAGPRDPRRPSPKGSKPGTISFDKSCYGRWRAPHGHRQPARASRRAQASNWC